MKIAIGVVGYSGQKFDTVEAERLLRIEFDNLIQAFSFEPSDIEIVSGYTNLGIPGLAYKLAREYGFSCTGIASQKAKNYECFPCDVVILDDDWLNWGDESETFLGYCDCFIQIGGGKQSFAEMEAAKKLDKAIVYYPLEAIN
jgi:hypothetical protein